MMFSYGNYDAIVSCLFGGVAIISMIFLLLIIALFVIYIIANWKLFKKAGKRGWESIVPIYNNWVLVEIAHLNWWWFLFLAVNIVIKTQFDNFTFAIKICGFLGSFNCYYNVARKFGKDKTTSIFAGIFPFIFIPIFAFSKDEIYNVNIPVSKNGIFSSEEEPTTQTDYNDVINTNSDSTENNKKFNFCGNCGTKLDKDNKFCPNCGKERQ